MLEHWGAEGMCTQQAAARAYVADLEQKTAPVRGLLERCGLDRRPTQERPGDGRELDEPARPRR